MSSCRATNANLLRFCAKVEAAEGDTSGRGQMIMEVMLGDCTRCYEWTQRRRTIRFIPSNPRAFGASPGGDASFYFVLCSACMSTMSNAEQRKWATELATEMATELLGADGPPQ